MLFRTSSIALALTGLTTVTAQQSFFSTMPSQTTYYHLPLNGPKDLVSVYGEGIYSGASVQWIVAPPKDSSTNKGDVEWEVVIKYEDESVLDDIHVSTVDNPRGGGGKERGLKVVSPIRSNPPPRPNTSMDITVRLPPGISTLDATSLNGPAYATTIDLPTSLLIRQADLQTAAGAFTVKDLTVNALSLKTSAGAINLNKIQVSDQVSVQTTGGTVNAKISLVGDGKASVTATSQAGQISVEYVNHPSGKLLDSTITTTTGQVSVTHQPAFEGSFALKTTLGSGKVNYSESKDPAHKGRQRHISYSKDRHGIAFTDVEGSVWWGESQSSPTGSTAVTTTVGSATINLN